MRRVNVSSLILMAVTAALLSAGGVARAVEPIAPYPTTAATPGVFDWSIEPTSWQSPVPDSSESQLSVLPPQDYGADKGTADEGTVQLEWYPGEATPFGTGGHPSDWPWGCGGSPYRTGPGMCDDWKVGPIWNVAVDGFTLYREHANLAAIEAQTAFDSVGDPLAAPQFEEQFNYGGGGRVSAIGKIPYGVGYRMQFAYEGVEQWNASIIYPKLTPYPGGGEPDSSEQRRVNYRSTIHSAELNVVRRWTSAWQPYGGIRYMRFDDELTDLIDQQTPMPLPSPTPDTFTATDRLNLFDIENNLIGVQCGLRRDVWQIGRRFTLQGFVNAGAYYNLIKRTNQMSVQTTQWIGEDTDDAIGEIVDTSTSSNSAVSESSDIAFLGEASLSGICRLNRCLALRGGYQVLWIDGLRLADDAFLATGVESRGLLLHGWHAGVEYRR